MRLKGGKILVKIDEDISSYINDDGKLLNGFFPKELINLLLENSDGVAFNPNILDVLKMLQLQITIGTTKFLTESTIVLLDDWTSFRLSFNYIDRDSNGLDMYYITFAIVGSDEININIYKDEFSLTKR